MVKYTTLSEELSQLSMERQEAIRLRASEIYLEEITLGQIGEKLGLSSSDLATFLDRKFDQKQSLELNSLRLMVKALGGTMEIIVRLPNQEPLIIGD
jgi:hypothetical protein